MFDLPVCGCDGNSYMNACWATRGPNGGTGTTSAGSLFATFQLSDLVGVWHSKGAGAVDTLRLGADDSYELVEVEEPDAGTTDSGPCETTKTSSGTFAMSTYGITLTPDAPSNAQSMPTEFYVENTCPLGGPLQLTSAVLPGATVLVRQR